MIELLVKANKLGKKLVISYEESTENLADEPSVT